MSRAGVVLAWTVTLLAAFLLAGISRGGWVPPHRDDGLLRVTLSARPERIETCRRLSEAEMAERPAHMRVAVECEGSSATYRLRAWRDSTLLDDALVRGGGFRGDRPIHVLREYAFAPGRAVIRVRLDRVESVASDSAKAVSDTGLSLDRATREAEERERRRMEALPPEVAIEQPVVVGPGQVVLVTWNPERRTLEIRDRKTE